MSGYPLFLLDFNPEHDWFERIHGLEVTMELLKRIQELLLTKDVAARFDDDDDLMFFARCGPIGVRICIVASEKSLVVRGHIPMFVPENRRPAMTQAISMANWQLRFSRLEMDPSDGEICCRADMPLFDGTPSDKQLTQLIYSVWNISEMYAAALMEVMTSQIDPALAIAQVEARNTEPTHTTQVAHLSVN
jgi:uncharacterized protein YjeT (DUF2065 family)